MQPDAAAPGMNINVQIFGTGFDDSTTITTSSSDIVVGPSIVTDETGDSTTTNGKVLTTVFFINATATPGPVTVFIDSSALFRTFEIVDTTGNFVGTGDYSAAAPGTYTLGNDQGINGNRTIGGTIVLDSLIVPNGITLNINVVDIDPIRAGNQGYLPAMIIVDGPVEITGTGQISVNGTDGTGGDWGVRSLGGKGGPGGGGGGGGGSNEPNLGGVTQAGDGGPGFAGGGGGGLNSEAAAPSAGGDGGDGTGITGNAAAGNGPGGDGGHATNSVENRIQNGTAGPQGDAGGGGAGGSGGGGGSGFIFGEGGKGWDNAQPASGFGGGNGGGADSNNAGGGGGGFGTAGSSGAPAGDGEGSGGQVNANNQLVPFAGGSGAGGGSPDNRNDMPDRHAGAGGGGGGALIIMSSGNMTITGRIDADGGDGGDGDCCGTGTIADHDRGAAGGGGSGGAIVLQSSNVTVTAAATLTAVGGAGGAGDVADQDGGDGGDGRIRVDGLPVNVDVIEPLAVPGSPTEFVGPAITTYNGTHLIGTGTAFANVNATIQNGVGPTDSFSYGIVDSNGNFNLTLTVSDGTNYITVIHNTTDTNHIMSPAATHILHKRTMTELVTTEDDIFQIGMRVGDEVGTTEDILYKAPVTMVISDEASVQDTLRATAIMRVSDLVTANDDIFRIGMRVGDEVGTTEDILYKAPVTLIITKSVSTWCCYTIISCSNKVSSSINNFKCTN